ncbi:MAG TPA: pilus assembly protein PilM [bacterium]|nr:pilus assembly protein PilM [bacterium]
MARAATGTRRPTGTRTTTARRPAGAKATPRRGARRAAPQKKKLGRKKRFATAIDIGHYSVKIATVALDEAGLAVVQRATVQPLDLAAAAGEEDALHQAQVKALKAALHSHGRLTGRIVLALPRDATTIRYITLPSSRHEELKEMLFLDAERHIPFSVDNVEIDFEVLEKLGEHESRIMMVSAPRSEIEPLLDICHKAGVNPETVDVDILGACHAYMTNGKADETKAIIDFGRESTGLGIISNNRILFSRSLSVSESKILQGFPGAKTWSDLRTRLTAIGTLPPKDRAKVEQWIGDLYVDLMRSVSAFVCEHPGNRVGRIILCGGGPYLPSGPSDSLAVRLQTKSVAELPLDGEIPSDSSYQGPELAVAIGLALRALRKNGEAVNLLPRDIIAEQERKEQRAFFRSAFLLGLLAFLFCGVGLYLKWEEKYTQLKELRAQVKEIEPETKDLRYMQAKVDIVDSYLDRDHSCLEVLSTVLQALPDEPPQNVALNRIIFKKRETLTLEGLVRTSDDVNRMSDILIHQLSAEPTKIFRSVSPGKHTERDTGIDGLKARDFTFECDLEYKEYETAREKVRHKITARTQSGR